MDVNQRVTSWSRDLIRSWIWLECYWWVKLGMSPADVRAFISLNWSGQLPPYCMYYNFTECSVGSVAEFFFTCKWFCVTSGICSLLHASVLQLDKRFQIPNWCIHCGEHCYSCDPHACPLDRDWSHVHRVHFLLHSGCHRIVLPQS